MPGELEHPAPTADDAGVHVVIPLAGFVLGLAVGRWWAVTAAVPFALYILAENNLEGNLGEWVAFSLSTLLAFAIGCGVALRRLGRRR